MAEDKARAGGGARGHERTLPPLPKQGFSGRAMPLHRERGVLQERRGAAHRRHHCSRFQIAVGWMVEEPGYGCGAAAEGADVCDGEPASDAAGRTTTSTSRAMRSGTTSARSITMRRIRRCIFWRSFRRRFRGKDGDAYRAAALRGIEYLLQCAVSQRRLAAGVAAGRRISRCDYVNDDAVTESAELLTRCGGWWKENHRG